MFSLFNKTHSKPKKILILNGNPKADSFCKEIALQSFNHLQTHSTLSIKITHLNELSFDSDLTFGFQKEPNLERDLINFQKDLTWADHIIIVSPIWWGSIPAKLKGLIDRTFLPGFAFKYSTGNGFPEKLLKGKTASLYLTMDTPPWYYKLIQKAPGIHQLKITILAFCGIKTTQVKCISPIKGSTNDQRNKHVEQCISALNNIL